MAIITPVFAAKSRSLLPRPQLLEAGVSYQQPRPAFAEYRAAVAQRGSFRAIPLPSPRTRPATARMRASLSDIILAYPSSMIIFRTEVLVSSGNLDAKLPFTAGVNGC